MTGPPHKQECWHNCQKWDAKCNPRVSLNLSINIIWLHEPRKCAQNQNYKVEKINKCENAHSRLKSNTPTAVISIILLCQVSLLGDWHLVGWDHGDLGLLSISVDDDYRLACVYNVCFYGFHTGLKMHMFLFLILLFLFQFNFVFLQNWLICFLF